MGYLLAAMFMNFGTSMEDSSREAAEGPSHLSDGEKLHSGHAGDGASNQIKWAMRGSPPYARRPGSVFPYHIDAPGTNGNMSVGAAMMYPWDAENTESFKKFRSDGGFLKTNWVEDILGQIIMWCSLRYKKGDRLPFLCFPSRDNFEALTLARQIVLTDQIVESLSPYVFACVAAAMPGADTEVCKLLVGSHSWLHAKSDSPPTRRQVAIATICRSLYNIRDHAREHDDQARDTAQVWASSLKDGDHAESIPFSDESRVQYADIEPILAISESALPRAAADQVGQQGGQRRAKLRKLR